MPTLVRFRWNKLTGEVEEFLVDDQNRRLSEAEHDRIALEVAQAIERRPALIEVDVAAEATVETQVSTGPVERETVTETPDREQPQRTTE
jgi:hypothetical protein